MNTTLVVTKSRFFLLIAVSFMLCLFVGATPGDPARERPNVILIFLDDMGYGDLSVTGALGYKTPNIDQMAAEGTRFTNFLATQAVCSASRAALLTGCYPNRIGIYGALGPASLRGLNPDEETIAELLKEQGYATGIFGKWHLGFQKVFLPLQHGFDEFYGVPYSHDMWPLHPNQAKATINGLRVFFSPMPITTIPASRRRVARRVKSLSLEIIQNPSTLPEYRISIASMIMAESVAFFPLE